MSIRVSSWFDCASCASCPSPVFGSGLIIVGNLQTQRCDSVNWGLCVAIGSVVWPRCWPDSPTENERRCSSPADVLARYHSQPRPWPWMMGVDEEDDCSAPSPPPELWSANAHETRLPGRSKVSPGQHPLPLATNGKRQGRNPGEVAVAIQYPGAHMDYDVDTGCRATACPSAPAPALRVSHPILGWAMGLGVLGEAGARP